jgi:hypothetical protein
MMDEKDNPDMGDQPSAFINQLVKKAEAPKTSKSFYFLLSNPTFAEQPPPCSTILGIDEQGFSQTGKETINHLENENSAEWQQFKWKLLAFLSTQDIFDGRGRCGDFINIFRIWYFYYESKYLLLESLLCGFNGFYVASNALLRSFLEFTLLQTYYCRSAEKTDSYELLERYFRIHKPPNWNTVLKNSLPQNDFAKPIRKRVDAHLKSLSKTASHPYHPEWSPKRMGAFEPGPTLEGLHFWLTTSIILDSALWVYFINFPMLFHPQDLLKKFGFGGPVGLFIDANSGLAIEKSLDPDDYQRFKAYANKQPEVASLIAWLNEHKDLNEDEIVATWNTQENGELHDIMAAYSIQMAKLRALREATAWFPEDHSKQVPSSAFQSVMRYETWQKTPKHQKMSKSVKE